MRPFSRGKPDVPEQTPVPHQRLKRQAAC
jgi:hypothetical protein